MIPATAFADPIRIATYNAGLSRKGPGLLLRDIMRDRDPQISAAVEVIAAANPDILVLTDFDFDGQNFALAEFANLLAKHGADYPYLFAQQPNTGIPTGLDLDKNGKLGEARDAQGFGWFQGQGGVAVLSRLPIGDGLRDFSKMLWSDMPNARLPAISGLPYYNASVMRELRLASTVLWQLPVRLGPERQIDLLIFYATTPVFDGVEDRNGTRNADQMRFWSLFLDGQFGPVPDEFILAGDSNLDPNDGAGHSHIMRQLLAHPLVQDTKPTSEGGANGDVTGTNKGQKTPRNQDTAEWPSTNGPGNLRVDYVVPSRTIPTRRSGVFWPDPEMSLAGVDQATVA